MGATGVKIDRGAPRSADLVLERSAATTSYGFELGGREAIVERATVIGYDECISISQRVGAPIVRVGQRRRRAEAR